MISGINFPDIQRNSKIENNPRRASKTQYYLQKRWFDYLIVYKVERVSLGSRVV